jgi:hypothetical protein
MLTPRYTAGGLLTGARKPGQLLVIKIGATAFEIISNKNGAAIN